MQHLPAFVNMTMNVRQELCAVMVFAVVEKAGSTVMEDKEEVCQIYLKLVNKLRLNCVKKIEFRAVFQIIVERNYTIAISTPSNWLRISRQFFKQWKSKPELIATSTLDFTRVFWFIGLFAPVVIGRSNFLDSYLKTALSNERKQ